jgi:hypothetical protein
MMRIFSTIGVGSRQVNTREGWIAMPLQGSTLRELKPVAESVFLQFTDAFDNFHEVDSISAWLGKKES